MSTTMLILALSTASQTFNLPVGLLSALCFVESSHNPAVTHKDDGKGNSVGLCQVKLQTAQLLGFKGAEADLKNPAINAYYAAKYLSKQLKRYKGDARYAVAAYNAGTCRFNSDGLIKNRLYVGKVFKVWGQNL